MNDGKFVGVLVPKEHGLQLSHILERGIFSEERLMGKTLPRELLNILEKFISEVQS